MRHPMRLTAVMAAFLGSACTTARDDGNSLADTAAAGSAATVDTVQKSAISVTGGGPVIQILPGPAWTGDSAAQVISRAPAPQQKMLTMMATKGPFSDETADISGSFAGTFWDRGPEPGAGDSVSALATFKTEDAASWRVVIDRVAPQDGGPMDPHWGGVGTDVTYHGATGLGVPLVPTVRAAVSYYGMAHVYRNEKLIDDNAPVHVMLTSQTRGETRGHPYGYLCWDCTKNPVEQLHLMLMPPEGRMYQVPGGVIHVMWQKSAQQPAPSA